MGKRKQHPADTTKYRWATPYEWLCEYLDEREPDDILAIAKQLAEKLDSDTLQDLFQEEMDADEYFEPLPEEEASA